MQSVIEGSGIEFQVANVGHALLALMLVHAWPCVAILKTRKSKGAELN